MKFEKDVENEEFRRFWDFVDRVARQVAGWPAWMKGGPLPEGGQNAQPSDHSQQNQNARATAL
jgi:hypothetical protein